MIVAGLIGGVVQLAAAIVERIPEPDPEIRRMRLEQRHERQLLWIRHRQEMALARDERKLLKLRHRQALAQAKRT